MGREKKNKLSIYLIKKEVPEDGIIVQDRSLKIRTINKAKLYVRPSATRQPKWVTDFFGTVLNEQRDIFSSMPSAALVIPVQINANISCHFVITFGAGHHLLQKGVFEERFGLRVVLNAVDEKNIRRIDKKNLGALVKQTTEQAERSVKTSEFGINIEQDLVQAVTGLSADPSLGKMISGRDSLHVSIPNTLSNIDSFLKLCFKYSNATTYKNRSFSFIDQIEEIRDSKKIEQLNSQLMLKINSNNYDKLWMSIPEIIDWADFACFKYRTSKNAEEYSDLQIFDFIKEHEKYKGVFALEMLKKFEAYCYFEISPEKSWRIYDCIYTEISEKDRVYTLTNGKWYQINHDFTTDVEKDYSAILSRISPVALPGCPTREGKVTEPIVESQYNEYAAKKLDYALLDMKEVMHSGSPIEICDLYTKNKEFIHVKHYGGSGVLSHLFNQGVVSAELFSMHSIYRQKMNDKLPVKFQVKNPDQIIIPEQYKIIFGVISDAEGELKIPFFSKVSLRNSFRRLNLYRYDVYLQKIEVDRSVQLKAAKKPKKRNGIKKQ